AAGCCTVCVGYGRRLADWMALAGQRLGEPPTDGLVVLHHENPPVVHDSSVREVYRTLTLGGDSLTGRGAVPYRHLRIVGPMTFPVTKRAILGLALLTACSGGGGKGGGDAAPAATAASATSAANAT